MIHTVSAPDCKYENGARTPCQAPRATGAERGALLRQRDHASSSPLTHEKQDRQAIECQYSRRPGHSRTGVLSLLTGEVALPEMPRSAARNSMSS